MKCCHDFQDFAYDAICSPGFEFPEFLTNLRCGRLARMFFMTKPGEKGKGKGFGEQLIIFGDRRARRGAELKVMSTIEHKNPGVFTKVRGRNSAP